MFIARLTGLIVGVLSVSLAAALSQSPPPAGGPPKAEAKPPPRVDAYGDPLPEGAIARLGTLRLRHQGTLNSIAYSPDGKMIASCGTDGTVRLWEAATGKELHRFGWDLPQVDSVAFSSEGTRLAAGSAGGTVRVWVVGSWQVIFEKSRLGTGRAVALSPDGRILAAAGSEEGSKGLVQLWDVASGQELKKLSGHTATVLCLAFSPDGKTLATGSGLDRAPRDASVRLWDVATGQELHKLEGHKQAVRCLAFSPDGNTLASGSFDALCLWEWRDGKRTLQLQENASALAFSRDGMHLAHADLGQGSLLKIRDLAKGRNIRLLEMATESIVAVAFSPDSALITAACSRRVRSWRLANGEETPKLAGHGYPIDCMACSDDGKILVTGAGPDEVIIWDVAGAKELRRLLFPQGPKGIPDRPMGVKCLAISPRGDALATVTGDGRVRLWELATGKLLAGFEPEESNRFSHAVFLDDGKTLAACRPPGVIVSWDISTGRERSRHNLFKDESGFGMEFRWLLASPDGKTLASSYVRSQLPGPPLCEIMGWDVNAGREAFRLRSGGGPLASGGFSRSGTKLVGVQMTNASAAVWDLKTQQEIGGLKGFNKELARLPAIFCADDDTVALAGDNATIVIWDIVQGRITRRIPGHAAPPTCFAFPAKPDLFASGSADTTVLVWKNEGLR